MLTSTRGELRAVARWRSLGQADDGAEIADVRAFEDRDHGRISEAPGLVWREVRGTGRIRGGHPSPDVEVLWGWTERKLRRR